MIYRILILLLAISVWGCDPEEREPNPVEDDVSNGKALQVQVLSDKSKYNPGEEVKLSIEGQVPANLLVRYSHLGNTLQEVSISDGNWVWTPPMEDFKGYLVELVVSGQADDQVVGSIAVDVSSDWTKFPRYGFVSKFPSMSDQEVGAVVDNLVRHRINGIQFYDWHYKHHQPLAGTPENPIPVYKDIINRDIHLATVQKYIAAFQAKGASAMFYNLIFGASNTAEEDGIAREWYLFRDQANQNVDYHGLPQPPFISNIYLLDPSNSHWINHMVNENQKVYVTLPFDGFHMDQLGDRGTLYNYHGHRVNLPATFGPFVDAMKAGHPDKKVALNAVNQFGKESIAQSNSDFLYTEVWGPNERFLDLVNILMDNGRLSNWEKNTVLAAYMNYEMAEQPGHFNTPGVLLTDAVIFAFGGSHIELGEHMLGREYFPNNNLKMRPDLQEALVRYYDFMTAYQNLLRDGGRFLEPNLSGIGQVPLNHWPPQAGSVSFMGKEVGQRQVVHLLNFRDATTLNWRDNHGAQAYPNKINNVRLALSINRPITKVWMASPDIDHGAAQVLEFSQNGAQVSFTLPSLTFWDMVVFEYE